MNKVHEMQGEEASTDRILSLSMSMSLSSKTSLYIIIASISLEKPLARSSVLARSAELGMTLNDIFFSYYECLEDMACQCHRSNDGIR